jgi:DNA-binding response OmpR family regulator
MTIRGELSEDNCHITRARPSSLLLVEDDQASREALARRLQRRGYEVVACSSGEQALDLLRQRALELVLLDIRMPGMDGFEVLRAIRAAYTAHGLPVIMLTASGQSQDIVAALHLGANDYVSKPVDFAVLAARTPSLSRPVGPGTPGP